MESLTFPGFIIVYFIHMKFISYLVTQLLLLTFLMAPFALQKVTTLTANYHSEYPLVFHVLMYLSLEFVVYHPTIPFLICAGILSSPMTARASHRGCYVSIHKPFDKLN